MPLDNYSVPSRERYGLSEDLSRLTRNDLMATYGDKESEEESPR